MDFEKAVNKFKTAGGKLDETEKMRYLIKSLPTGHSHIEAFIDVIREEERTVEYVRSKIKEKNMNKLDNEKKSNVSAVSTRTQEKCYTCRKVGHRQKDYWQGKQGNRGRGAQFNRGQRGTQRGSNRGQRGIQRDSNRGGPHRGRDQSKGTGRSGGESKSADAESTAA